MKESDEDILKLAQDTGFSHAALFREEILAPMHEVRDMCADGRCGRYGKCWSCPPGCGTLTENKIIMDRYDDGLLVQTTGELDGDFDAEGIKRTEDRHKKNFSRLARRFRAIIPDCLPLSAGSCTICPRCTYPYKPCRFPDRIFSSMEAYGLLVSDVCEKAGLRYYYGPGTMTFSSCILF